MAARGRPLLLKLLRDRGVAVEVCPTSNVHTGSIAAVSEHPALEFLAAGLVVVPCADNTLLSQTTTSQEYFLLAQQAGVSKSQLGTMAESAHTARFSQARLPTAAPPGGGSA